MISKHTRVVSLLAGLFLLPITGAWAWFHVANPQPTSRLALVCKPVVQGLSFVPDSIGPEAIATLATTNFINGTFADDHGGAYRVFAASWSAGGEHPLNVVQHSPDICWANLGWVSVDAGQPDKVRWHLGGADVPFECRAFRSPDGMRLEFTVWCTLVGGRPLEGGFMLSKNKAGSFGFDGASHRASRVLAVNQFLSVLRERVPGGAEKQFVRFSMTASSWVDAERALRDFAAQWLTATN